MDPKPGFQDQKKVGLDYHSEVQKIEARYNERLAKFEAAVKEIFGDGEAGESRYRHMLNDRGYIPTPETERLAPLAARLDNKKKEIESEKEAALKAIEASKPPEAKRREEIIIEEI
ncbi:hypothetical protein A2643_02340 [Candidatus Nomurabacteria bacterium RIFCSPHIGHO2_01_FULL_39_220]|uniref:Uncharacterized protein n=1 Tax=Candidatus Nomurabacteria bacterium RIFCSPLOWO2_02_FULL_40_67 TaxID=1801787 RepID=A0A1F6Y774_9BACT|nr:MAG: hypothetical protein UU01_C0036G0008 [Parcubacteria group bacterium GW2011_GWA2_40_37]KKS71691.1 MAG: hypothetical protein UV43_C0030G0009 [Parcubacteria group bacterium GW2011_GWF2_42_7]OGI61827.1 MAG: hypothetical protein A2W12_04035 [Candidatus Nomurabacteria bacterium RBG_16_40_11]OGI70687.1 MAG: hypothetical protein A2643_02340 [Candidatus Nomurabacteria bacterium RIFCSPHIGHO2_01_FULL_39_220]OGI71952.1 MAG: hypothetical protein A2W56_03590 [Candidatus Nomurabacteria bacterium RIFCS